MPVLLEGSSVVVRLEAIGQRYSGFWPRFVEDVPNRTLCSDGEIAAVNFMDSRDAAAYVEMLVVRGLRAEHNGEAADCVIVEHDLGPRRPCPWLEQRWTEQEGARILTGRLVGGQSSRLSVPSWWSARTSPWAMDQRLPTDEFLQQFEYLRSEGSVDVYRRRTTSDVVYVGRTSHRGRGRIARFRDRLRRLFARSAPTGHTQPGTESNSSTVEQERQAAVACLMRAEQGDAEAQYELGARYSEGRGVALSYEDAATWYRKAACQGLPIAQFVLSAWYAGGRGVAKDESESLTWLQRAADQGYAPAESQLSLNFYWGRGVPQSFEAAATWAHRAAERGDATAQQTMATLCRLGQGVPLDEAAAAGWYRRAAEQGEPNAQFDLAVLLSQGPSALQDLVQAYKWIDVAARCFSSGKDREDALAVRDDLQCRLTRSQLAEAETLAREWRATAERVSAPSRT